MAETHKKFDQDFIQGAVRLGARRASRSAGGSGPGDQSGARWRTGWPGPLAALGRRWPAERG